MLYSEHTKETGLLEIPKGIDFVIAVAMNQMVAEKGFNKHVQEAYNAGIPCIAMLDVKIEPYSLSFSLPEKEFGNPWPSIEIDPYIRTLDKMFLAPNGKIYGGIDGIMIDMRNIQSGNSTWVTRVVKHLKWMFEQQYVGLPIYVLTASDKWSPAEVFLSTEPMLSTYAPCGMITDGSIILNPVNSGKPSPNWNGVKFWWYGSQRFEFLRGTASMSAPVFQYRNTKDALHRELNFVEPLMDDDVETEPEVDIPEVNPEIPEYNSEDLVRVEGKLDALKVSLDSLTAYIKSNII
jgi:hypothetical protein